MVGSGIQKKPIPDPGSGGQKGTGSGSATLNVSVVNFWILVSWQIESWNQGPSGISIGGNRLSTWIFLERFGLAPPDVLPAVICSITGCVFTFLVSIWISSHQDNIKNWDAELEKKLEGISCKIRMDTYTIQIYIYCRLKNIFWIFRNIHKRRVLVQSSTKIKWIFYFLMQKVLIKMCSLVS